MTRTSFPNHQTKKHPNQRHANDHRRPWEQRQHFRHWCQQEIICESYDSLKDQFNSYPATLANTSHGGAMFIAGQAYDQGTPILMRSNQRGDELEENNWQKGILAEVVWCRQPHGYNPKYLYQVGAKYFDAA